ncbi:MAG TPA: ATP-binding protein [Mesotoga infera]|jgi:lon-related putative ATP-dependent protease|uniref:endopeptidase La n=1 Tax=Mesotoga infera TaxID=1236046 RepID=A0A7Z7PQ98_9BACT|nr:ATP-binding protein [Mesotoga infera]MBP8661610.1 AAA family ATPase [Mesotoga sp.]NLI06905.1 AAA family ATPase [Thermotogaceae bacterium]SSC12212.1 putative ATP-dependent protease [Mesotoga infera]HON28975.1 ATP-binding protein [Mesotoga infera]HPD37834.1 ATP-binding protein [Mesotoga infera]
MRKLNWREIDLKVTLPRKVKSTKSIDGLEEFIGQERAIKALETGLKIKARGYNIFVSGSTNTGRRTFVSRYLKKKAEGGETPGDWIYVYNFDDPRSPNSIPLKAGMGKSFQKEMGEFVEITINAISESFQSEDYQQKVSAIQSEQAENRSSLLKELIEKAREKDFTVQINQTGVATIPLWNGKPLTQEIYEALPEEYQKTISKKGEEVRELVNSYILRMSKMEKEYGEKFKELNRDVASFALEGHIKEMKDKFSESKEVTEFIDNLRGDLLDNLGVFFSQETDAKSFFGKRYAINLFVDNSGIKGKPIVEVTNANYSSLFGRIEYLARMGMLDTDHSMIRSGAIHRSNGGYLVLDAKSVLSEPYVWQTLKQLLFSGSEVIENLEHKIGLLSTVSLKPEPIPLDIKIIMIGEPWIYSMLSTMDTDFKKLFKIKAEFDWEMRFDGDTVGKLCGLICSIARENSLMDFDRDAVKEVIKKAIILSGNRKKVSTQFGALKQLLLESSAIAEINGGDMVSAGDVTRAWEEMKTRVSLYQDKVKEMFADSTLLVQTEGELIGEINGLTVVQTEDLSFGIPVKITAKVGPGNSGIVDIQKESELSGNIHDKAGLTIQGYMNSKYAREFPLSLNGSISFEQVYSVVDGDSASVAETIAFLSAIAEVPIKQSIAVTGSINQSGRIQPVGGVQFKVEGFYELCKLKGLNGKQGVAIPETNFDNLVLPDEIVQAIKSGRFNIWTVETVDEAIELLTGLKAGQPDGNGKYPEGTFNNLVMQRLERFYEISIQEKK